MNVDRIEIVDEFDCARHTKATQIRDDGMVEGDAFATRRGEPYLSLNCLDLLDGETGERLDALRLILSHKLNISRTARLSILNVGETKRRVSPYAMLDFRHEPEEDDNSHCGIYGMEYNDELVQDLVAESVVKVVSAHISGP